MANEKNLKPFNKGESGNPGGRPKWALVSKEIRNHLDDPEKIKELVETVFDLALKGNMRAIEFIADRVEGKVAQNYHFFTEINDEPIKVFDISGIDDD